MFWKIPRKNLWKSLEIAFFCLVIEIFVIILPIFFFLVYINFTYILELYALLFRVQNIKSIFKYSCCHIHKNILASFFCMILWVKINWSNYQWMVLLWNTLFKTLSKEHDNQHFPKLVNIGSCNLHVLCRAFQKGAETAGWKLKRLLKHLHFLFHNAGAHIGFFLKRMAHNSFLFCCAM